MLANPVELDVKTIEALASDTRRNILKKLKVTPGTVSEISRAININKSAVSKHLNLLMETGLITKRENGNEFIYYELTFKGKNIIDASENVKFTILLSSSIFFLLFGALEIALYLREIIHPGYWGVPTSNIIQLIAGIGMILVSSIILYYLKLANKPQDSA